jgi:hypothetical protein
VLDRRDEGFAVGIHEAGAILARGECRLRAPRAAALDGHRRDLGESHGRRGRGRDVAAAQLLD